MLSFTHTHSGTTTIHRPHGAGTIVIRPSVTHRPYAYHRPSFYATASAPSAAPPAPAVVVSSSSSSSSSPTHPPLLLLPLPQYTPPPKPAYDHFADAAASLAAVQRQPVIESLLLSSREPPTAGVVSVLDNTIAASDLETAASISTGMCVQRKTASDELLYFRTIILILCSLLFFS